MTRQKDRQKEREAMIVKKWKRSRREKERQNEMRSIKAFEMNCRELPGGGGLTFKIRGGRRAKEREEIERKSIIMMMI